MFCTNCGKMLPEDSVVCGYCGAKVDLDDDMIGSEEQQNRQESFMRDVEPFEKIEEPEESEEKAPFHKEEFPETQEPGLKEETAIKSSEKKHFGKKRAIKKKKTKNQMTKRKNKYDTAELPKHRIVETPKRKNKVDQMVLPAGVQVLNKRNRPMKTASFFWTQVVLLIPVLNILLLFIWAFRKHSNANRKAYARSILIWMILVMVAVFSVLIAMLVMGYPIDLSYWIEQLKVWVNSIPTV